MRLFIAEKPSLGRAIADVLPKPLTKSDGFIVAANGDTVSWCIGHLLEQAEPEAYDPAYKKWNHEHLPIIPTQWKLIAKKKTKKQLSVLRKLVKQADQLIHAGDPDREGQLLVDEVIHFLGVSKTKTAAVKRCLISDLNPSAVERAIKSLRPNRDFIPLSVSALARSRADWLYGINLTRAYTLQGQKAGYNGVLSVGRVQTPILGLVVRRDNDINNFVSTPFYEVWANLQTIENNDGTSERPIFKVKWQPSKECQTYLDDQGRNLSKALAHNVAQRISNQSAVVHDLKREHKRQTAPLPYNLSSLQIDASKAFSLSAQQVLDTCQTLYERHKLITYPRSDCRYLPKEHFNDASTVINAVQQNAKTSKTFEQLLGAGSESSRLINMQQKSRAWNDSKVSAHHAIIPTQKKLAAKENSNGLSNTEEKIYRLVCRNYIAQFLPKHEFYSVVLKVNIGSGLFISKAKEPIAIGWKCVFPSGKNKDINKHQTPETYQEQKIPALNIGQPLKSLDAEVVEKQTSPPKAYNDATLLAAMTGINAHVSEPELKKVLKETDGLGTEATRAGIIELLFKRGYLQRQGKTISSTPTGQSLIQALPDTATRPDMTALWESKLSAINDGSSNYNELMAPLEAQLHSMANESRSIIPTGLKGLGSKAKYRKRRSNTKNNKKAAPTKSRNKFKKSA